MMVRYKIIFVGDVFVGKTSIMNKMTENDKLNIYEVITILKYSSQQ